MMKKRIIIPAVIVVIGVLAVFWVNDQLNSKVWWAKTLTTSLNASSKDLKVREVVIDNVKVDIIKGIAVIEGLAVKFKISGDSYFLSTGICNINNIHSLFKSTSILNLEVNHLALVSDAINASDVSFEGKVSLQHRKFDFYEGKIESPSIMFNQVGATDVKTFVHGDLTTIKLSTVDLKFYEGKVIGEVLIGLGIDNNLSVNASLTGINLAAMEAINKDVFSQMHGLIDGQIQITAKQGQVSAFRGRVIAPQGGIIKAALLKFLAQYVPQRQQIEALIAQDDTVPLDKAQLETVSFNDEKFASQIRLFSSQLNLDMNITLDINIEGGLKSLMTYAGILGENL